MEEEIYRKLARHMDRLPGGFPPSSTGADLRLLQFLFAPQEAELATYLTLDREPAGVIAERASLALPEAEKQLDEMAVKGLILSTRLAGAPTLYQAVPFVVGIWELQGNNLTQEFLDVVHDYWRTAGPEPPVQTLPQMRTIPIHESIKVYREALPYDRVEELVQAQERFAVTP
jgi:electron transport complex protein RnfB